MSDFSRSIIKWVVIGLIIFLVVILITNIVSSSSNNKTPNNNLSDNTYESGKNSSDDIEDINPDDIDGNDDIDGDSFTDDNAEDDTYYVNAPDTASSSLLLNIIGLSITTTGIIYIFNRRIRKSN